MPRGKAKEVAVEAEATLKPEETTIDAEKEVIEAQPAPEVETSVEAETEPAVLEALSNETTEPELVIEDEAKSEEEATAEEVPPVEEPKPAEPKEPEETEEPKEEAVTGFHSLQRLTIKGLAKPYKTDADPIGGKAISGDVYVVDGEISRGRIRVFQAGGPVVRINVDDLDDGE